MAGRTATAAMLLVITSTSVAGAEAISNEALFATARAAIERGAPTEAIENLELLADRGVHHPDASFNRALAYVARAESPRTQPGDLGRAAAALAESIRLGGDDDAASDLLEQVRQEIARRRVRKGSAPIAVTAGLGWAVVDLLSETAWAFGACVGSALVTLGLSLTFWSRRRATRVTSALLLGIGGFLLICFGSLTVAARHRRLTYDPAVVVAPDARLSDLAGRGPSAEAAGHDVVPEGAEVRIVERKGHRVSIEWDGAIGWVSSEAILALPRP